MRLCRAEDRWLFSYLAQFPRWRVPRVGQPVHLLLCIADHFEPKVGGAGPALARERVRHWAEEYPQLFSQFKDSDGRPPQHTFFFPAEEYEAEHLDALAGLCRAGFGEVEVHLHHDHDTATKLRARLVEFKETLAERHGLLARRRDSGEIGYAFIHGNWALNNSRPDGRWCGVNDESTVLRETGCYADFTMPSAPAPAQTRKINRIYYACSHPHQPMGHDCGMDVGSGPAPPGSLLMIQGPLLLDWGRRKWGLLPRLENGCLQQSQPLRARRLDLWLSARVQVPARPDWFFVKLHTHGAPEGNRAVLLGEDMLQFHETLAKRALVDRNFHFHYVTAREMYNLARAAENGHRGTVAEARDHELVPNTPVHAKG